MHFEDKLQHVLKCVQDLLLKHKDVGMGLSMTSCLGIGILLFPFFFMK